MQISAHNTAQSTAQKVTEESVKNEVLKLNIKKSSTGSSIPATILKQSIETYLPFFGKSNKVGYH